MDQFEAFGLSGVLDAGPGRPPAFLSGRGSAAEEGPLLTAERDPPAEGGSARPALRIGGQHGGTAPLARPPSPPSSAATVPVAENAQRART